MQGEYRSLDPAYAETQAVTDRMRLQRIRLHQSRGGEISNHVAALFGATASVFMYNRLNRNGFTILPLQRHKVSSYSAIILFGFLFYRSGYLMVMDSHGDKGAHLYQCNYNYSIIFG